MSTGNFLVAAIAATVAAAAAFVLVAAVAAIAGLSPEWGTIPAVIAGGGIFAILWSKIQRYR